MKEIEIFDNNNNSCAGAGAVTHKKNVTAAAAAEVGVQPPWELKWKLLRRVAWKCQDFIIPLLHLLDTCKPPDSKLSLKVLWWKALAANNAESVVHDGGLAYDMLPSYTRIVVHSPFCRFYPRLVHGVVEIRTAYLNQAVRRVAGNIRRGEGPTRKIRLVCLGGGYDVRSIQLRQENIIGAAVELDLPHVITAKQKMFDRLQKRRPNITDDMLPTFYEVNLNELDKVYTTLEQILQQSGDERWHTIFLLEGVLLYLNKGVPDALLGVICRALQSGKESGTLCFADGLENIPHDDVPTATQVLARHGWRLVDWLPKGGKTRHMGISEMTM